jgi:diguanylate cyclase (GGDEF)-like protein
VDTIAEENRSVTTRLQQLPLRHRWLRWAVLALSLAFAAGSSYFFYQGIREEARSRFARNAIGVSHDVDSRIRANEDVLYAMRGLFDAADRVTRDDFHEFAEALALPKRYPGITNINFAIRLSSGQKREFERAVRAERSPLTEGLPEFSIKPPGERPEYIVLHYIEPLPRSAVVWGNDLSSDSQRRSALQRARDTGEITSTSGITLESDTQSQSRVTSLLFRLAVYRGRTVPNTLEDRRRLYRGLVGSTIRIGEMVQAALPRQTLARVRVIIREGGEASDGGTNPAPGVLLYDSEGRSGAPAATDYSAYTVTQQLGLADRSWQLDIVPLVNPVNPLNQTAVAAVFAVSLAASILLFWMMSWLALAQSRGFELAQRNRSAALLNEFGEVLHASPASQQACEVIARYLPRLLPETAGALFVFGASRSSAAMAAQWGDSAGIGEISTLDDCQSLRQGHLHSVADSAKAQNCRHFKGAPPRHYACVPLSAQGEPVGVLHLQRSQPSSPGFSDAEMGLVKAVAQHADLALANLKLRDSLRDQSTRDYLTGLYNRRFLEDSLERDLARAKRGSHPLAVLMLDVDHFKRFNDRFGHETGDVVLRELGKTIKGSCRTNDLPCRFGGEEFTVVLADCRREDAMKWGERLLGRIRKIEVQAGGVGVGRVTTSIGLALYPEDGTDLETLLQAADIALYQAKRSGRDRLVAYQGIAGVPGPADANGIPGDLKAAP